MTAIQILGICLISVWLALSAGLSVHYWVRRRKMGERLWSSETVMPWIGRVILLMSAFIWLKRFAVKDLGGWQILGSLGILFVAIFPLQRKTQIFATGICVNGRMLPWDQVSWWFFKAPNNEASGRNTLNIWVRSPWLFLRWANPINTCVETTPEFEALLHKYLPGKQRAAD